MARGAAPRRRSKQAAQAIRATAPRQVLVELCAARYGQVLMTAVAGLPPRPPPRVDLLGHIHGGLLGHELSLVLKAARDVGAAVVPIDRPGTAIRSRIGQILWHPRLLQGLLRYGSYSLLKRSAARLPQDGEAFRRELESHCPAAHRVFVEERSACMATQIRAAAAPGADAVVVCGAPHCGALAEALRRPPREGAADDLARTARRFVP